MCVMFFGSSLKHIAPILWLTICGYEEMLTMVEPCMQYGPLLGKNVPNPNKLLHCIWPCKAVMLSD